MNPAEWKVSGKYLEHNGHQIFYKEFGKGEPLLLLHGFPTCSYDWHLIVPELAKNHHVLCFDMIGYGYSDKPIDYHYTLFDQADIALELVNHIGWSYCHVLAHDKGDTVANILLARDLESKINVQILSCCMLNGGLFPGVHKPRPIQWLLMTPIGKYLSKLYTKGMLTKTFNKIFGPNTQPSLEEMTQYWELMEYNNGRTVFHKLIYYMQERIDNEDRWLNALQNTNVPLRLIDGAHDPISGEHMAAHYKRVIPNPDVVLLKNIGHYPQIEAPKEVLQYYAEFRELLEQ